MLIFAFILATSSLLLQSLFPPLSPLLAYSPFIALAILRAPIHRALWAAAAAGALIDLLSDDPMGLHALNYAATALFLYRYRSHFLYDQPFHFSLVTALVSALSTTIQLGLLFLFDRRVPFDGKWILADILAMPVVDALYAFVWFSAPLALFERTRRTWMVFWLKKKNLSQNSQL